MEKNRKKIFKLLKESCEANEEMQVFCLIGNSNDDNYVEIVNGTAENLIGMIAGMIEDERYRFLVFNAVEIFMKNQR